MKRQKLPGKSARRGNQPAPYTKYEKKPFEYTGESRLANGDLKNKANDSLKNKYA